MKLLLYSSYRTPLVITVLNSKKMKLRSNVSHWLAGFPLDYQMNWNDCIAAFEERKLVLLEVLKSADCKISLTADTDETMGYMCVACHFINTDWKLQRKIIKFVVVESPHNGVEIFSAILRCMLALPHTHNTLLLAGGGRR